VKVDLVAQARALQHADRVLGIFEGGLSRLGPRGTHRELLAWGDLGEKIFF
jgi:hypothetical protein